MSGSAVVLSVRVGGSAVRQAIAQPAANAAALSIFSRSLIANFSFPLPAGVLSCLRDTAYGLTVPSYTLTDGPDTIHLIRYPLQLGRDQVAVGDDGIQPIDIGIDVDDPLGDLVDQ